MSTEFLVPPAGILDLEGRTRIGDLKRGQQQHMNTVSLTAQNVAANHFIGGDVNDLEGHVEAADHEIVTAVLHQGDQRLLLDLEHAPRSLYKRPWKLRMWKMDITSWALLIEPTLNRSYSLLWYRVRQNTLSHGGGTTMG